MWYLRQMLPLLYRSRYRDSDGRRHFCVWRMWFGRCFAIDDLLLDDLSDPDHVNCPVDGG